MSFKKEVIEKLTSIEMKVHEQAIQLGLNNRILDEHHKRSLNLEERVKPLEQSHVFFNKMSKVLLTVVGVLASIASIYRYLLSK